MVHVKQYAKRELRQLPSTNNEVCKWLGKRYEWEMHYWDRPWEIDAHGREKGLVIDYGKAQNMGTTPPASFQNPKSDINILEIRCFVRTTPPSDCANT
jgi:hypothetical protein